MTLKKTSATAASYTSALGLKPIYSTTDPDGNTATLGEKAAANIRHNNTTIENELATKATIKQMEKVQENLDTHIADTYPHFIYIGSESIDSAIIPGIYKIRYPSTQRPYIPQVMMKVSVTNDLNSYRVYQYLWDVTQQRAQTRFGSTTDENLKVAPTDWSEWLDVTPALESEFYDFKKFVEDHIDNDFKNHVSDQYIHIKVLTNSSDMDTAVIPGTYVVMYPTLGTERPYNTDHVLQVTVQGNRTEWIIHQVLFNGLAHKWQYRYGTYVSGKSYPTNWTDWVDVQAIINGMNDTKVDIQSVSGVDITGTTSNINIKAGYSLVLAALNTKATLSGITGVDISSASGNITITTPRQFLYNEKPVAVIDDIPKVVHGLGSSEVDVMSQKAVTNTLFADGATARKVQIGNKANASGTSGAIAIGLDSVSSGGSSIAIGDDSKATANDSISIGTSTASGVNSVAIGGQTRAEADNSVAIGYNSQVKKEDINSVSVGAYTEAGRKRIINVADGVKDSDAATYKQAKAAHTAANNAQKAADGAQTAADKAQSTADTALKGLDDKQDTLISSLNIKTIDGQSILGPGNISLSVSRTNYIKGKAILKLDASGTVQLPQDFDMLEKAYYNRVIMYDHEYSIDEDAKTLTIIAPEITKLLDTEKDNCYIIYYKENTSSPRSVSETMLIDEAGQIDLPRTVDEVLEVFWERTLLYEGEYVFNRSSNKIIIVDESVDFDSENDLFKVTYTY